MRRALMIFLALAFVVEGAFAFPSLISASAIHYTPSMLSSECYTYFDYPIYDLNVCINNDYAAATDVTVQIDYRHVENLAGAPGDVVYTPYVTATITVPPGSHCYLITVPLPRFDYYFADRFTNIQQGFRITVGSTSTDIIVHDGTTADFNYCGGYYIEMVYNYSDDGTTRSGEFGMVVDDYEMNMPRTIDINYFEISPTDVNSIYSYKDFAITASDGEEFLRPLISWSSDSIVVATVGFLLPEGYFERDMFPLYIFDPPEEFYIPNELVPRAFVDSPEFKPSVEMLPDNRLYIYVPIADFPFTVEVTGANGSVKYTLSDPLIFPLGYGINIDFIGDVVDVNISDAGGTILHETVSSLEFTAPPFQIGSALIPVNISFQGDVNITVSNGYAISPLTSTNDYTAYVVASRAGPVTIAVKPA